MLPGGWGLSWESQHCEHSVILSTIIPALLSPSLAPPLYRPGIDGSQWVVRMLKWLVTGKEQANSQIPQKKINKKKQVVSSEDPVAVIENYKYNITR